MTARWDNGTAQSSAPETFVELVSATRELTVMSAYFGIGYDGHVYHVMLVWKPEDDTTRVTIIRDGIWAGDGRLLDSGRIDDCAADLSEDVYEALEAAIQANWHGPQPHNEPRRR